MQDMENAERERLQRMAHRIEDDYDYAERAGFSQETLDRMQAQHERIDAKLSGDD